MPYFGDQPTKNKRIQLAGVDVKSLRMSVSSGTSCILALSLFVLLFAVMQVYKVQLASSKLMTVVGGYLGSLLFMLALTGIGNLESSLFGRSFQTKLIPEVLLAFGVSMLASGLVHRVCITTCFLFSLVMLYYMNKLSLKTFSAPAAPAMAPITKGKRK